MIAYSLRRLAISIPVILAASLIIFGLVSLSGDPLGDLRSSPNVTQAQIDLIREVRGLDQPFWVQYWYWLSGIPTEGFGTYLLNNNPIWPDLRRVIGNTLQLVLVAEIIALGVAVVLGVISAKRQYSFFDYLVTSGSFFGYSMPVFWIALILQIIVTNFYLATDVRIFYTGNLSSPNPGTGLAFWVDRAQHLALPIIALAIFSIASYSRYMRASMLEVINSDYVRTARAKGVTERTVTYKHTLRNALIPLVTVSALSFGTVLGGAVVTEFVFALDGMGLFFLQNLSRRDPYAIMAWLMVTAVAVVVANLIADLLYGYLDPRIRND